MNPKIDLTQLAVEISENLPNLQTNLVCEWESLDITVGTKDLCFSIGNDGEIYIDSTRYEGEPVDFALIEAMAAVIPLIKILRK